YADVSALFISSLAPPSISTHFPYTTLFRSYSYEIVSIKCHDLCSRSRNQCCRYLCYPISREREKGTCERPEERSSVQRGHCLPRSEEHTSELQSRENLVCRLLLEKKKK